MTKGIVFLFYLTIACLIGWNVHEENYGMAAALFSYQVFLMLREIANQ